MADETIEIDVNVNDQGAAEKFTRLQTQIKQTRIEMQRAQEAGDSLTFNRLKGQLDDLEDKLEVTQLKSKQFDDALAGLPGPAGKAGQAIKGLDGVFKLIAANPIVATIAGLAGLFMALIASLKRTEEGTKALTRITEGFEKILNAIFAVIEPLALAFADFVGDLLENQKAMKFLGTTVGIVGGLFSSLFSVLKTLANFVINNFTNAFRSLTGVLSGVGQVLEGVFTFNFSKIKAGVSQVSNTVTTGFEDLVDNVKETGKGLYTAVTDDFMAGFDAAESSFEEGSKRLTKKQKEQSAKNAAEAQKAREEAAKVQLEAELSLMSERDRKLRERELKFNEDKKKLIAAGITDFTNLEKAYREDVADINKEFDEKDAAAAKQAADDAAKKREDELKKALDDEKLALDLKKSQGLLSEKEYQDALFEIKKKYAVDAAALTQAEIDNNNTQRELEKQALEDKLKGIDDQIKAEQAAFEYSKNQNLLTYQDQIESFNRIRDLQRQRLIEEKATQDQLVAFDKETKGKQETMERAATATKLGIISGALGTIAQAVGENTVAGKALAIAQATIDTYAGANKALATYPPPFGAIAAGTVILAGLLNVRKILSTKVPAPPGTKGVSGGGGGGGSISAPAVSFSNPSITAPQVGATASQQGTIAGIVAGTMNANQSQSQPLRAYVVQNDIRTESQLDRRIRTAARLGG
jgi:hypothetical protein